MKTERPINLTADEVRAVLAGRKTQKRFVLKPQPDSVGKEFDSTRGLPYWHIGGFRTLPGASNPFKLPYSPGDRLWVREAWYCDDYRVQQGPYLEVDGARELIVYRADDPQPYEAEQPDWKPSIHMPRWASRITLDVTDVRIQRVQDISVDDVDAEGFGGDFPANIFPHIFPGDAELWGHLSMPECFGRLWDSINLKRGHGWAANPWVAAVTWRWLA